MQPAVIGLHIITNDDGDQVLSTWATTEAYPK